MRSRWVASVRCVAASTGRRTVCALLAATLWLASGATSTVLAADPPPHELVMEGNKALEKGEAGKAMEYYDKAAAQLQDSPEIAYDQGVAYYRGKDFDKATERFSKALSTPDSNLDAKARFNLGNCAYASALKVKDKPKEAIEKLKKASDFFQDVLESHPNDKDARGNLERAQLLIKQLKEEEKPPESQPASQPQSQPQSQPASQPTSRPESQPQSQPASRPESQPSQQDKDKKQGQDQQGEKKDGQEQQGEQKDAQQKDAEKKDGQQAQGEKKDAEEDKDKQEQAQAVPATQQAMSKEEVQRLLQMIRDKQKQRMDELQRRERGPMRPVDKDW